jgi:hypothetical protein
MLRNPEAEMDEARKTAALTALVPFIGSAVYCMHDLRYHKRKITVN